MRRPLLEDEFLCPDHLKDPIEVVVLVRGEYDKKIGEYGPDQEVALWSGMGSIQPYVRESLTAVQPPLGGIALAIDAFKVYLPWEALEGRGETYRIKSKGRYFEPKHKPFNPGGQQDYWVLIVGEVNR